MVADMAVVEQLQPQLEPAVAVTPSSNTAALRMACLERLDPATFGEMTQDRLLTEVERLISESANERRIQINGREQRQLATDLVHDMVGLGPLEPLLEDDAITDIMVNGPSRVFVERRGKLVLSPVRFRDTGHVGTIAQRIAAAIGRRVDESSPMVDARLPDRITIDEGNALDETDMPDNAKAVTAKTKAKLTAKPAAANPAAGSAAKAIDE